MGIRRFFRELFCDHGWDKTRGYDEIPMPGATCGKCGKINVR